MYDNYNYPPGADTPSAPWNEPVVQEMDFDVTVSQTLSRDAVVTTDDYIPYWEDGCDDGIWYHEESADTSDTDWVQAYKNSAWTPLEIIRDCKKIAQYLRDQGTQRVEGVWLKGLIESCDGWVEDELEVIKA